ncbi:hypothetical protein GCM10023323_22050 [Streptomyces thinghirensis]|uniref:Uncharacterized protein n=1 Tax=Streptomyces thinghirensis TaxID=551547 RepID=A0ABP9T0Q7_9ACTN
MQECDEPHGGRPAPRRLDRQERNAALITGGNNLTSMPAWPTVPPPQLAIH